MVDPKIEEIVAALKRDLRSDIRYNTSFLRRPFIIEFFGIPDAGKTTIITGLDNFLRRLGFDKVYKPQEGAEAIRHIPRNTPLYNERTAMYAINILVDQSSGHQFDFVLFDRCAFDGYFWMEYWHQKGKLSKEEKDDKQAYFLSPEWIKNIDLCYFVTCKSTISSLRDQELNFSGLLGTMTNPTGVALLENIGKKVFEELSPKYPDQLKLLDTTEINKKDMVQKIAEDILFSLGKIIQK